MEPVKWHSIGAQLLEAGDALYLSPNPSAEGQPRRGGVPILFPQFAKLGELPKHGFARNSRWSRTANDTWALHVQAHEHALWPYVARLEVRLTAHAEGLRFGALLELSVLNLGLVPFEFTGGLHPYWAVQDITGVELLGLEGLEVSDRYEPLRKNVPAKWKPSSGQALEVLAKGCPDLFARHGTRCLHLRASGFSDWMIWNPGSELAFELEDMPAGDWQRFICIEPVCVNDPIVLNAGQYKHFSLEWTLQ